jgi:serine/threonine-protein phosphatase 6 regulatory ankyrin repeat subunit B
MATETRYKLHEYARRGDLALVRDYVENNGAVDQLNRENQTALLVAAGGGHYSVAKFLLEHGAKTNVVDRAGWTALHHAAQNGNEATVELLLKGGEKVTKETRIDANIESGADRSPLGVALSAGNLAAAVHLVDAGADCTWVDQLGRSLAFFCVQHLVCIKFLMANGVDISQADQAQTSPLHIAAEEGNTAVMDYLITNNRVKVDANVRDVDQDTPFHAAARAGKLEAMKFLNKIVGGRHGALDAVTGYNNATAVHLSAMNGHIDVVQYLINSGVVDINAQDDDGRTALHCACADGAEEVVKLMVAEGARMDISDNDGYKPLHHAALNENDTIVKYLLVQTAMHRLNDEAAKGPQLRRDLREYRAKQAKDDLDSFDIPPPSYGGDIDFGAGGPNYGL